MSIFRVYFYDTVTRRQIDTPLNGKSWIGTSGNIKRNGEYVRGTATFVEVADFASLRSVKGARKVTAADFDRPVTVKVWNGPGEPADWRKLVSEGE